MANGLGFAHHEFPSGQTTDGVINPLYQFPSGDEAQAGSLVDLASAESFSGAFKSPENYMRAIAGDRQKSGYHHEQDERLRREKQQYIQTWKTSEAERIAEERAGSSVPWEFQSVGSAAVDAYESIGAGIMRTIEPETSDWMVRATQARSMGLESGMTKDELGETRKWFNTNLYGASRSFVQAGLAAAAAKATGGSSFAFMATTFGATSANESYVEAIDYGLSHKKAYNYAWKQGAFEAGVMTSFQMVGLGGFEKMLAGKMIWTGLGKQFGKAVLAELSEEEITTVMQEMSRVAAMPEGKYRNAWVGDDGTFETSTMKKALMDTAVQTLFMMGAGKALEFGGDKGWSFMIDPSRNSMAVVPDSVTKPLEEKHGDLSKKENRQAASDDLFDQYVRNLGSKGEFESEVEYWNSIADSESRTGKEREVAAGVAVRLDGGEYEVASGSRELLGLVSERMRRDAPASPVTIPPPAEAQERKVNVPQVILQQDPNAEIVDPLDMIPEDINDDELVRMLSVVKELSGETRGGRDIRFVQTEDPYIKGVYSGDGIFLTVPKVKKYMKDGVLDEEGLRKALTGTFAHEYTHELKRVNEDAWNDLFDSLSRDSKYGPLIEKGREKFMHEFTLSEYLADSEGNKTDPYADLRGEANKDKLEDLAREESLAYLMDEHFVTTGLVSKMARLNSTSFEMLRDWLRRIRNSLFRDKLYKGMVGAFNEVAADMGIQPIAAKPVVEKPKKPRRKKPKKSVTRSRNRDLAKGLPEWAEGPVTDLEKRGSKVTQKNHVSDNSVVVTVKTKAGNTRVVTLRSRETIRDESDWTQRVQNTTKDNHASKVDDAISDAMTIDAYSEEGPPVPEGGIRTTLIERGPEAPAESSAIADQVNDDLGKLYGGLRDGHSDEDANIESTDVDAFAGLAAELGKQDENGPYLEAEDASDIDVTGLRERGLVFEDEDGKFRLTSLGQRVMGWEGPDEVGEYDENVPDELDKFIDEHFSLSIEGLDDKDVELMELATLTADIALTTSPYTGRAFDLIEEIWGGDVEGEIAGWMRKNKPGALKDVVNTVWNEHHEGVLKEYGGELSKFIPIVRKRMISGKHVTTGASEWRLLQKAKAVVPHPLEYRQLGDSSERLSIEVGDLNLPEDYIDGTSKHHVDERTRAVVDKVRAHSHIKTPTEIRTHLQDEVSGQMEFNKNPEGTILRLIEKGKRGDVFTSTDWVKAELGHTHMLHVLDAGGHTAEAFDGIMQSIVWLAQYSNEAASEWGRAGAMMRDRVESVRDRGRRAMDKAMFSETANIRKRLAYWKGKQYLGISGASEMVAKIRAEWAVESQKTMDRLRAKGWDLDQLDKYMGSRESVEAFVHEALKEKGEVGTVGHILYEMFINFILSGPLTHVANISSNALMAAYEFGPKRHAHAILNEFSLAVGLGEKMGPRIGEIPYLWKGIAKGLHQGCKHWWRSIVSEEEDFERSLGIRGGRTKVSARYRSSIRGPKGRVVRFFGTTGLTAFDSFQKSVNTHAEVMAFAYRDAKHNGLVDDQVGEFIDSVMEDKTHRLWMDALTSARDKVFQGDPSAAAKGVLGFRRTVPGAKWFLPFIITPDNLLRKGVSYSPLGAVMLPIGVRKGFKTGDWSGLGEQAVQQMITYSIVMMMMGDDEEDPWITGTSPSQPKEWASAVRKDTIPPMSVKVGDGYFSYARFEPFSTWLALSKDAVVAIKTGKLDFTVEKLSESLVELMKEKTFMRTVSDFGYLLNDPKKGSRRVAAGFITAAIPNLYKQIVRAGRDTRKERRDWGDEGRIEMWAKGLLRKAEIPIFEDYDKFDQYGNKIPENYNPFSGTKSSFWYNLLVPAKGKSVHMGVGDKLLRRWNEQNQTNRIGIEESDPYFLVKGSRQYLTKEEYGEYTELQGKIFKGLVDSEAVDIAEPEEAYVRDLWKGNWRRARSAAQEILKNKWQDLPYEQEIKEVVRTVHENNINKRITVLAKPNPSLSKQKDKVKKYPMARRREALDAEMKELIEEKKEAADWMVRQGYTAKNYPKLTQREGSSWYRSIKSFREFSGGVKGERKRNVPPRVSGAR